LFTDRQQYISGKWYQALRTNKAAFRTDKDRPLVAVTCYNANMLSNLRHEAFAVEYVADLSATAAAVRAGYSERSARQIGSRLLKRPEVADRIADLLAARRVRTEAKADEVVERLHKLAQMCMTPVPVVDDDGRLLGMRPVNASGAAKALELLGRTIGLFTDRHENVDVVELEWQTVTPAKHTGWDTGSAPDPDRIEVPATSDDTEEHTAPDTGATESRIKPQCRICA
jgi:phage terminase small subunit